MDKILHYIIVALRSFKKNKVSFALSFMGLTVAFSLCLISGFMFWTYYNSDGHWDKADRIYKFEFSEQKKDFKKINNIPSGLLEDFKNMPGEIEAVVSTNWVPGDYIRDNKKYSIFGTSVDDNLLDIFDLEVLYGDLKYALSTENIIAMPDTTALEVFGNKNPVGETLVLHPSWGNGEIKSYTIGAIYKRPPLGSILNSFTFLTKRLVTPKENRVLYAYISLHKDVDVEVLQKKINVLATDKYPKPKNAEKAKYEFKALKGARISWMSSKYMKTRLYGLVGSSFFMLIIAVLNYMSLSTAMAAARGKDVALRKIMGASRKELTVQYLIESLLLVSFAYLCALGLAEVIASPVADLTGEKYAGISIERLPQLFFGWGVALLIGTLSSVYPIWGLVHGSASTLLQNFQRGVASGGAKLRTILLTVQAMCGLGLAFAASVIYQQATFQEGFDKGFDEDNLMYLNLTARSQEEQNAIKPLINDLMRIDAIDKTGLGSRAPFQRGSWTRSIAHPDTDEKIDSSYAHIGEGYFDSLGAFLLAGRLPAIPEPQKKDDAKPTEIRVVVNQMFLKLFNLGTPVEALGKCVFTISGNDKKSEVCQKITAVIKNYHQNAEEQPVVPMMYEPYGGSMSIIIVRTHDGVDIKTLLPKMEEIWDRHFPARVFKYNFVDDLIKDQFRMLRGMGIMLLITGFATLFLTIAGLYAMARFVVNKRRREIAIRRVVGASSFDIMQLVVYQLAKPVVAGALIGIPIGWYYALDWLQSYTVRISPEPWQAIVLGLVGISFFLLSVSGEVLRAVRIRPAEALHHE